MESSKPLPVLNEVEQRVLGALIEKSKITPDYYPMTLNGLTAACNQKTSRKPVVEYSEETVLNALNSLKGQSLVSTAVGGGSRVTKYKHNFTTVYPVTDGELAAVCLLLLRGPQTPGELNTNSGRLHEFASLESVLEVLSNLSSGQYPYVKELPRRPGQKEARFKHLLGVVNETEEEFVLEPAQKTVSSALESRVEALENEVARMRAIVDELNGRNTS